MKQNSLEEFSVSHRGTPASAEPGRAAPHGAPYYRPCLVKWRGDESSPELRLLLGPGSLFSASCFSRFQCQELRGTDMPSVQEGPTDSGRA